jgi:hypothetical protein
MKQDDDPKIRKPESVGKKQGSLLRTPVRGVEEPYRTP